MKTGTTLSSKGSFALEDYSTKPKKNMLMILMSKVFPTTKIIGKQQSHLLNNIILAEKN